MSRKNVSLIVILRNQAPHVESVIVRLHEVMTKTCVDHLDHEILVVDNGSTDGTSDKLRQIVQVIPSVRVVCLVSDGDTDVAALAGMEKAIGDIIVIMDPTTDSPETLSALIEASLSGYDMAIAMPSKEKTKENIAYRILSGLFVKIFSSVIGVGLRSEATMFRAMTRHVVRYVIQHETARYAHRALPSLGGFKTISIEQTGAPLLPNEKGDNIRRGIDRALGLLTSTSAAPLRLATATCALAAILSMVYSVYVAGTYMFRSEVTPGWTTLSLQLSAMFFLLSVAVGLLSEYVLRLMASSFRKPPYHVASDFHSSVMTREQRLNVVNVISPRLTTNEQVDETVK